jgi:hypothetical protein
MRTKLTNGADLARQLAERARESHKFLKAVVNDAVQHGLNDAPIQEAEFSLEPHPGGLKAGIDARRLNELAWEPDGHR